MPLINPMDTIPLTSSSSQVTSRYKSQKRRDWNTFGQYLTKNHHPPLSVSRCSGAHVLEFLRYLDQFGKTRVHSQMCPFYGHPNPPAPCPCPLRQAWGSLDALVGRLRAAFDENGGKPEANPFGARAVSLYLREVRDLQAKARGISYGKKRKRPPPRPSQNNSKPKVVDSGWLDEPSSSSTDNGRGGPEDGPGGQPMQHHNSQMSTPVVHDPAPSSQTAPHSVPSAPPIPDGPIHYPSIDSSPIDLSMPDVDMKKPESSVTVENSDASALCVICLDDPKEVACVPCGHVVGCMNCLNDIKAKNWGCPVCRAKINQVIKLYNV